MSEAKISEDTVIATPLRNIITIIAAVAIGTWAYFGVIERLNILETNRQLMEADLLKKAEQTPKNLEIFMLIEHNAKILEKHQELLDENIHSQVMIKNLEEDLKQAEEKIEYLLNLTRKLNGNSN